MEPDQEKENEAVYCDACKTRKPEEKLISIKENPEKLTILTGWVMCSSLGLQESTRLYNTPCEMFTCLEHLKLSEQVLSKILNGYSDYFIKKNTLLYEIAVEIRRSPISIASYRKGVKSVFGKMENRAELFEESRKRKVLTRNSHRSAGKEQPDYIKRQEKVNQLKCGICASKNISDLRKIALGNDKLMLLIGMVLEEQIEEDEARNQFSIDSQFFACQEHVDKAQEKVSHTDCFNTYMYIQSINKFDGFSIKSAWKCYQHFAAKYQSSPISREPQFDKNSHNFIVIQRCHICNVARIDDRFARSKREDFRRIFEIFPEKIKKSRNDLMENIGEHEILLYCPKHLRIQNAPPVFEKPDAEDETEKENEPEFFEFDDSWRDVLSEHSYCKNSASKIEEEEEKIKV
ncbi:unnamed protein product [Caenorhabditis angaria]|uniref:Lin-15A/B-like domain-containing protein n=1 Tax=Caenorhabditis angaria TaxID=860376 RepID=A0A9P1N2Q5_9PELO|nr:unnamed protein product [Caenorhabditis angaria]